jgi:hypothetical protein
MRRIRTAIGSAAATLAVLLLAAVTAHADPPAATGDELGASWASVGDDELGAQRGGAEVVQVTESKLRAAVSNNSVGDGSVTGTINFDNSFHDNSGIQSSMVNSGNNVSMQSSMTVNVYLD